MGVGLGFYIVKPQPLPAAFEAYRGRIVDIFFQEFQGFGGQDGGCRWFCLCLTTFCHFIFQFILWVKLAKS